MKKFAAFLTIVFCIVPLCAWSAVNVKKSSGIKKAAPVATQQKDKLESVASLLPTAISFVSSVKNLRSSQEALSADCVPSSSEIDFVNDLVKEWAKTGMTIQSSAVSGLGKPCNGGNATEKNDSHFKGYMETHQNDVDSDKKCYESFSSDKDKGHIWLGFPRASSASICNDYDTSSCETVSNVYDVFAKIPFTKEDYKKAENAKATQFLAKAERCSPNKMAAAKLGLYGNFVTQTLSSIGQTSGAANTGAVLEAVTSMGGSGNIQSMLPSLGSMATQLLDK